jgi:hypothetical protein
MNPELQRNAWLELSPHRLIAMPAVLVLGFAVIAKIPYVPPAETVRIAALVVFFALTLFWGTRLASDTISDEVRGKTWDLQRMSAISPWGMTWGKLFGSTMFAWYGGLIAIAAYLVMSEFSAPWRAPKVALTLIAFGVLSQAFAMAFTLQVAQKGWSAASRWVGMLQLLLLVICASSFSNILQNYPVVTWFGSQFQTPDFVLLATVVFALWAVFGAYREMCRELQVPTTPWAWLVFALFLSLFTAGFAAGKEGAATGDAGFVIVAGLTVSVSLSYLMLFAEANNPMILRRMLLRAARRQWRCMLEEMPCWPATLLLAFVFAVAATAYFTGEADGPAQRLSDMPMALVFFLVRDAAILLFFAFSRQPRRAEAAAILYITVLYWVLPGLLRLVGLPWAADFVFPFPNTHGAAFIAFAQAALAVGLCVARWRRNYS